MSNNTSNDEAKQGRAVNNVLRALDSLRKPPYDENHIEMVKALIKNDTDNPPFLLLWFCPCIDIKIRKSNGSWYYHIVSRLNHHMYAITDVQVGYEKIKSILSYQQARQHIMCLGKRIVSFRVENNE